MLRFSKKNKGIKASKSLLLLALFGTSCKDMTSEVMEDDVGTSTTSTGTNIKVFYDTPESSSSGLPLLVIKKPGTAGLSSLKITGGWAFDPASPSSRTEFEPTSSGEKIDKVVTDSTGEYYLLYMSYDMIAEASKILSSNPAIKISNPRAILKWTAEFGSDKRVFSIGESTGLNALPADTAVDSTSTTVTDDKKPAPVTPTDSTPSTAFAFDQTITNLMVASPNSAESDVRILDKLGKATKVIFELSAEWCGPCQSLARSVAPKLKEGMLGNCSVVTMMHDKRDEYINRSPWSALTGHIFDTNSGLSSNIKLLTGSSGSGAGYPTVVAVDRSEKYGKTISASVQTIESFCR